MLDNIVHLVYNTHMNDFEKQLKEALKKNLRVEVEIEDDYGFYGEHSQHTTARVYFGDELIYSSNYKENNRIHEADDGDDEWEDEDENEDEDEDNWND